jgi:hypothetical protein
VLDAEPAVVPLAAGLELGGAVLLADRREDARRDLRVVRTPDEDRG